MFYLWLDISDDSGCATEEDTFEEVEKPEIKSKVEEIESDEANDRDNEDENVFSVPAQFQASQFVDKAIPKKVIAPSFTTKSLGDGRNTMIEERLKKGMVARRYSMVKTPQNIQKPPETVQKPPESPSPAALALYKKPDCESILESKPTITEDQKPKSIAIPEETSTIAEISRVPEIATVTPVPKETPILDTPNKSENIGTKPPIAKFVLPEMSAEIGKY